MSILAKGNDIRSGTKAMARHGRLWPARESWVKESYFEGFLSPVSLHMIVMQMHLKDFVCFFTIAQNKLAVIYYVN